MLLKYLTFFSKEDKEKTIERHIKNMMGCGAIDFDSQNQMGFVEYKLFEYLKKVEPELAEEVIDTAIKKIIDFRMNLEIELERKKEIKEKIKDFVIRGSEKIFDPGLSV